MHKRVIGERIEFDTSNSQTHQQKDLSWAKIHLETCKKGKFYRTSDVYKENNILFAFYIDVNKQQKDNYIVILLYGTADKVYFYAV